VKNIFITILFAFLISSPLLSQERPLKQNIITKPYPYANPVIKHMYTADASPHVMPDGRVWMVTSVDHEDGGGYATMHKYHTFSSGDMVQWTDHGEVLHINDLMQENNENEDWALWAPDMIYRHGKYYLYYPVRILHNDTVKADGGRVVSSYIGVAVSDSPDKRFKVINPKIEGTKGIDPAVFIDDDDKVYLYWGSHLAARLKDNMIELATEPIRLDVGTDKFMEAIWMNKRNGKYQVNYHTKYNWKIELSDSNINDPNRQKSELAYSEGDSPLGPFIYKGVLNYEPGQNVANGPKHPEGNFVPWRLTLSNHGGVVEYHGQEYLFYHTSALSSWRQDEFKERGTWTQRSVCVDKLNYDINGNIIPVQQTLEGVQEVKISQPYEIDLSNKTSSLINGTLKKEGGFELFTNGGILMFEDIDMGTGYYYFELKVKKTSNCKIELRLDDINGKLLGTIRLDESDENKTIETLLRDANSLHNIYLVVKSNSNENIEISDLRFFAGSPL
jgi:hypothetical protein